jgi:hypothetical protein
MADPRDEDPTEELKQGLTHLWRAAVGAASGVKREVEKTDFGKELSGAGREFARAAANVVERITEEVNGMTGARGQKPGSAGPPHPPAPPAPPSAPKPNQDDDFDGVRPTRISVDDKKP